MVEVSSTGGTAVLSAAQRFSVLNGQGTGASVRLSRAIEGTADSAAQTFLSREEVNAKASESQNARGASIAQLAGNGLGRVAVVLERLGELAKQASDSALGSGQHTLIAAEFVQRLDEIDDIVAAVTFDGEALLEGTETLSFATGSADGETISFALLDASAAGLGLASLELGGAEAATTALSATGEAVAQVASARADVSGTLEGFQARATRSVAQAEQFRDQSVAAKERAAARVATQAAAAAVLANGQAATKAQASGNSLLLLDLLG